jgi:hypothetical protein
MIRSVLKAGPYGLTVKFAAFCRKNMYIFLPSFHENDPNETHPTVASLVLVGHIDQLLQAYHHIITRYKGKKARAE